MPSLNEIAYLLAEKIPSDKPPTVLLEMLKFTVIYYRAMFLRRDYSENLRFPDAALQEIAELKTELVDRTESKLLTSSIVVRRTVDTIPMPVRLKNWQTFAFVGGMDRLTPFTEVNPQEYAYRVHNKHTGKTACYYYHNGRLYVINTTAKYIVAKYMLEDPRQLATCADYSDDDELYIPQDMLNGIVQGILSSELRVLTPPPSAGSEIPVV